MSNAAVEKFRTFVSEHDAFERGVGRQIERIQAEREDAFVERHAERLRNMFSADLGNVTFRDLCQMAITGRGEQTRGMADMEIVQRGLSMVEAPTTIKGLVNTWFLQGFAAEPMSIDGWYSTANPPDFKPVHGFIVDKVPSLAAVARGQTAVTTSFSVVEQGWSCRRLGFQFAINEQDLLDRLPLDFYAKALSEAGRSAKRAIVSLAIATIFSNPAVGDGHSCFDS